MLNGELDHVLPQAYLKDMAAHLSKGYAYLFPGVAHSPVDSGPCALTMFLEFLADPSKAPDSACIEEFRLEFLVD